MASVNLGKPKRRGMVFFSQKGGGQKKCGKGSQIREFFDLNIMHHSFNQLYFCSSCKFACCCLLLSKKGAGKIFSKKGDR